MRLIATNSREHSRSGDGRAPVVHIGGTRDTLVSHAQAAGWDAVGHRWIRLTRGGVRVELWFTDVTARVVKARLHASDGRVLDVDVVHNRDRRMGVDEIVLGWLDAPADMPVAARRPMSVVSASQSSEFEAISAAYATPTADAVLTHGGARVSGWVRTDAGAV